MATPFKFYLKHMFDKTAYRATWKPDVPLKLGMIGILTNGVFDVQSSLEDEGLNPKILEDKTPGEIDYTSHDSVDIEIKLAGKAPLAGSVLTEGEAGVVLNFHKENGVVFQAKEMLNHQITNMGALQKEIVQKYKDGSWPKDWVVITQLVEAVSATIIISNSSNNKLELKASANVGAPNIKLTDASLGLDVAKESGSSIRIIAESGVTPLYRVMGIRHPFLGKPGFESKGIEAEKMDQEEFTYQDFDDQELDEVPESEQMEQQ
jgi:hypothetical protein